MNNLKEVNDTLTGRPANSTGKIGVFLPGQHGDIMTATSILKYKDILWPNKEIIWFCRSSEKMVDVLKYSDRISEVRHWPQGWELPERCKVDGPAAVARGELPWADFSILKTPNNRLDQTLKHNFELTSDLEEGYFPAPWMMLSEQRHGIDYPNVSRKVFGADPSWEWHAYLCFSNEERDMVRDFCQTLPHKKTVMLETYLGSGNRTFSDTMTRATMQMCRQKFGQCNFIFASHIDSSKFFDAPGVVSCSHFTVRQTALVNNYSDLFVGIGSGISVATSCWGNKPIPKIQYTGSFIGSTVSLANGPIEAIYHDHPAVGHEQEYYRKLDKILNGM